MPTITSFTYADPAGKSAETKICEALKALLEQIDSGTGFLNTVGSVLRDFPDSISSYPAITMLTGYEAREHFDNETLYITMKIPLLAFVDPAGDVQSQIETIKQDIHYVIGHYPGLPDDEDNTTCQLAIFSSAEPFGTVVDNALTSGMVGVKVVVDVTYQQTFADPTVN